MIASKLRVVKFITWMQTSVVLGTPTLVERTARRIAYTEKINAIPINAYHKVKIAESVPLAASTIAIIEITAEMTVMMISRMTICLFILNT